MELEEQQTECLNPTCVNVNFLSINGFDSDMSTIKCGVPKWYVLAPLLFLIYVNDLNLTIKSAKPIITLMTQIS